MKRNTIKTIGSIILLQAIAANAAMNLTIDNVRVTTLKGKFGQVEDVCISPDNSTVVTTEPTMMNPEGIIGGGRRGVRVARNNETLGLYDSVSPVVLAGTGSNVVFAASKRGNYVIHSADRDIALTEAPRLKAAPSVSPDGRMLGYILHIHRPREAYFVIHSEAVGPRDESMKRFGPFHDYRTEGVVFSADSKRWGFLAARTHSGVTEWISVIDGKESEKKYEGAAFLTFSPDGKKTACYVKDESGERVIQDNNKDGPRIEGITSIGIRFSPDSGRLCYVSGEQKRQRMVVDGIKHEPYLGIVGPRFSPDSKRLAYLALGDDGWRLVVEGREPEELRFKGVGESAFSPDGKRIAYVGFDGTDYYVVTDGKKSRPFDAISQSGLCFTPDGQFTVFEATKSGKQLLVVADKEVVLPGKSLMGSKIVFHSANELSLVTQEQEEGAWLCKVKIEQ